MGLNSAKGGAVKMNEIVSLKDIVVDFDGERILDELSLDIHDKEFVTFLGPSGCGKTTTLRVIAGFITPKSGNVFFDGKDIASVPPYKRQVNTVFQKYALFPHLNVYENVAFGLRLKKLPEETIRPKVLEMLETVGLRGFERRSINQLSGGQQQRVAIARSLVYQPRVLLLDEPLNTGLVDQAAGNGHALLLAAGQLVDAAAFKALQADDLEHLEHLRADLILGHLFQAQTEGDVLKHVQVREQRILLEHRVHRPLVRRHVGDVLAIKKDIARFRCYKAGNHTQGRRLAAARGAQEGDKLLVVDVQRKSVQDLLPIEFDNNVFQRYDQIFIHFYCIPLCGISRYSTLFTHRFFLGPAQSP